jgi:hypothetical protein
LSLISPAEGQWYGVRVCPLIPLILSSCPRATWLWDADSVNGGRRRYGKFFLGGGGGGDDIADHGGLQDTAARCVDCPPSPSPPSAPPPPVKRNFHRSSVHVIQVTRLASKKVFKSSRPTVDYPYLPVL